MHLAVIPDGNRRYMRQRGVTVADDSLSALTRLVDWCTTHEEVTHLSVFCWSSENWGRASEEVGSAMHHLHRYLRSVELAEWGSDQPLFVCCTSSTAALPNDIIVEMDRINQHYHRELAKSAKSANGQAGGGLRVYLYISYGYLESTMLTRNPSSTPPSLRLDRVDGTIPQVDCLIRTSGERRLSNFCMHKLAFAELVFVESLFPECTRKTWDACFDEFKSRHRRMGM